MMLVSCDHLVKIFLSASIHCCDDSVVCSESLHPFCLKIYAYLKLRRLLYVLVFFPFLLCTILTFASRFHFWQVHLQQVVWCFSIQWDLAWQTFFLAFSEKYAKARMDGLLLLDLLKKSDVFIKYKRIRSCTIFK